MKKSSLVVFILIFSIVLVGNAQTKKKRTIKKKSNATIRKSKNPRLVPPENRDFNHSFDIEVNYDKFENQTLVKLRIATNLNEALYLMFSFNGEQIKTAPKHIIFFYVGNTDNYSFPVKEIIFLTDKARLRKKTLETQYDFDGKTPISTMLDYPTFLRIANAESVEMKIGSSELTFTEEALEALKDFASRTNPNINRNKEIAERKALDKKVKDEVNKLIRLDQKTKNDIREILKITSLGLSVARKVLTDSKPKEEELDSVFQLLFFYNENSANIPNGLLKDTISDCITDIIASAIIFSVNKKISSNDNPEYKSILENAIKKYELSKTPQEEIPLRLLSEAEITIYDAYTLASMAGIVEVD